MAFIQRLTLDEVNSYLEEHDFSPVDGFSIFKDLDGEHINIATELKRSISDYTVNMKFYDDKSVGCTIFGYEWPQYMATIFGEEYCSYIESLERQKLAHKMNIIRSALPETVVAKPAEASVKQKYSLRKGFHQLIDKISGKGKTKKIDRLS